MTIHQWSTWYLCTILTLSQSYILPGTPHSLTGESSCMLLAAAALALLDLGVFASISAILVRSMYSSCWLHLNSIHSILKTPLCIRRKRVFSDPVEMTYRIQIWMNTILLERDFPSYHISLLITMNQACTRTINTDTVIRLECLIQPFQSHLNGGYLTSVLLQKEPCYGRSIQFWYKKKTCASLVVSPFGNMGWGASP